MKRIMYPLLGILLLSSCQKELSEPEATTNNTDSGSVRSMVRISYDNDIYKDSAVISYKGDTLFEKILRYKNNILVDSNKMTFLYNVNGTLKKIKSEKGTEVEYIYTADELREINEKTVLGFDTSYYFFKCNYSALPNDTLLVDFTQVNKNITSAGVLLDTTYSKVYYKSTVPVKSFSYKPSGLLVSSSYLSGPFNILRYNIITTQGDYTLADSTRDSTIFTYQAGSNTSLYEFYKKIRGPIKYYDVMKEYIYNFAGFDDSIFLSENNVNQRNLPLSEETHTTTFPFGGPFTISNEYNLEYFYANGRLSSYKVFEFSGTDLLTDMKFYY